MAILSTPFQYLSSIPPVTRGFSFATLAASSLYLWIQWSSDSTYTPYLTLVPGSSLFYPWTFVSSALVEVTILEVSLPCSLLHPTFSPPLACLLVDSHSTVLAVSRAFMGHRRDLEIYHYMRNCPKFYRFCFQLDRIRRDERCGFISVSTLDTL